MTWSDLQPTGATRDLWVSVTNGRRPEYGVFHLDDGIDVHRMLAVHGPPGLTEHVWCEVVHDTVVAAVQSVGLTGLDVEACNPDLPFPGEHRVVEPAADWLGRPVEPLPDLPRRPLRLAPGEVAGPREH